MYLNTRTYRRSGFTMIELMVAIAVLSVLMIGMYSIGMSMLRGQRLLDAKVKMRDEARGGMVHMMRNLRMANMDPLSTVAKVQYTDSAGVLQDWPPASGSYVDNIVFFIPQDLNGDGIPATNGVVDWTTSITFQLDADDINGDGKTQQVVQLLDGVFTKVLISDIAPFTTIATNPEIAPLYQSLASTGGFSFTGDADRVNISVIQRLTLGPGMSDVVTRYDDTVLFRNKKAG